MGKLRTLKSISFGVKSVRKGEGGEKHRWRDGVEGRKPIFNQLRDWAIQLRNIQRKEQLLQCCSSIFIGKFTSASAHSIRTPMAMAFRSLRYEPTGGRHQSFQTFQAFAIKVIVRFTESGCARTCVCGRLCSLVADGTGRSLPDHYYMTLWLLFLLKVVSPRRYPSVPSRPMAGTSQRTHYSYSGDRRRRRVCVWANATSCEWIACVAIECQMNG